jgi:hypothetical protein
MEEGVKVTSGKGLTKDCKKNSGPRSGGLGVSFLSAVSVVGGKCGGRRRGWRYLFSAGLTTNFVRYANQRLIWKV